MHVSARTRAHPIPPRRGHRGSTARHGRATLQATPLRAHGPRSGRAGAIGNAAAVSDTTDLPRAGQEQGQAPLAPLFEALYVELKRIAARRVQQMGRNQTLSATALVHEAFLKLADASDLALGNRQHFYACAAQAMRQILVDHARARLAGKRGGALEQVTLSGVESDPLELDVLDLERALGDLGEVDRELRQLVELRYFAGLTLEEIAELRGTSLRTANRDWQRARALLAVRLDDDAG